MLGEAATQERCPRRASSRSGFFQRATLGYYVGYIISAAIPFAISKFNFDEETPEENVARIKEMKPKKIAKWVLIVLLAIAISIVFILAEAG